MGMSWGTAGMLQGLGQATKEVSQEAQRTMTMKDIEATRQAMEDKRQERNIQAQRELQGASQAFAAGESTKQQAFTAGESAKRQDFERGAAETKYGQEIVGRSMEQQAKTSERLGAEGAAKAAKAEDVRTDALAAKSSQEAAQRLQDSTNKAHKEVAEISRKLTEGTVNASNVKEYNHSIDTMELNLTNLQRESNELVGNPSAKKAIDDRIALMTTDVAETRGQLRALRAKLGIIDATPTKAEKQPAPRPAYRSPIGAAPPPAQSGEASGVAPVPTGPGVGSGILQSVIPQESAIGKLLPGGLYGR